MAAINDNRINVLAGFIFLISFVVLARMFSLQIVKHSVYIALAEGQRTFLNTLFPERGEIFINDKDSASLGGQRMPYYSVAVNKPGYFIYAIPVQVKNSTEAAGMLAPLLNLPVSGVLEQLSKKKDYYEVLAHKVPEETVLKIKEMKIAGIRSEPENWRYWPENNLMAQVLGFVGFSGSKREGQYGIEGYFNKELEGKNGTIEGEQDSRGSIISLGMRKNEPAVNGSDLVLTIDRAVQYNVEQILAKKAKELSVKSAQAIVMEPSTGKIIAMANWPGFDLNDYSSETDFNVFLNKNIQSRYEPGSVIKPFSLAASMNEKKITPNTTYEDTGRLVLDGWTIRNSDNKANGIQTMTEVLEKSLNTGAAYAAAKMSKEVFYGYLKNFGFDMLTGIELQGEVSGDLRNLETKRDINYANASFGQGIAMTPIEIITGFASLVNGGKIMKPYIVDKIIKDDGSDERFYPEEIRSVITPETSAKISAMLVSVVENGHAQGAAVKGYWIGGKTGTAQVPFQDKRGYSAETVHTFIGFGPVPDPKFLVLVKMDEPKGVKFAEGSAVPVFNAIAKFLVNYMEIPPARK